MRTRGLTLIEMLAVVALIGLVSGSIMLRAGAAGDAARWQAAIAELAALDAAARSAAQRGTGVLLRALPDGGTVAAGTWPEWDEASRRARPVPPAMVTLPAGLRAWVEVPDARPGGAVIVREGGGRPQGQRPGDVLIDPAGRSVDYRIIVASDDGRRWTIEVAGLTGWTRTTATGVQR